MRKINALPGLPELFTAASAQMTLPLYVELTKVTCTFTSFDGGTTTRIDNPHFGGINTCVNPEAVTGINMSKLMHGTTSSAMRFAVR